MQSRLIAQYLPSSVVQTVFMPTHIQQIARRTPTVLSALIVAVWACCSLPALAQFQAQSQGPGTADAATAIPVAVPSAVLGSAAGLAAQPGLPHAPTLVSLIPTVNNSPPPCVLASS